VDERDTLLSIGRFAFASGLTVKALRHYDEIGLLRPAHVDGSTGYRYYDPAQLRDAVAIRRLRRLEVPLDEIGALVEADGETLRARLAEHRARVAASTEDKRRLLAVLDRSSRERRSSCRSTTWRSRFARCRSYGSRR
jgi:DNA-binding transcriptional MerR regulator